MEYWKDLLGYEGDYLISSTGKIKTIRKRVKSGNGGYRIIEEKIRIPNSKGIISIKGHPYDINSLLLQNFPQEYMAKFNRETTVAGEEWKDIKGYEGLYQVSNLGRVRSLPIVTEAIQQNTTRKGVTMVIDVPQVKLGRLLKLSNVGIECSDGYMKGVTLSKFGYSKRVFVHRLVAEAFIPNPNNLQEVNHKNRDRSDNTVNNLEWISPEDNKNHAHISKKVLIELYKLAIKENQSAETMLRTLINNYKKKG